MESFYSHIFPVREIVSEVELSIAMPVGKSGPTGFGLAQGAYVTVGLLNPKQHLY